MQKSLWEALALKDLPAYSSPTQKMAVAAVEAMAAEVAAEAEVAAATAAAMGVLTPQPCALVPAGTWAPMKPGVLVSGQPCLTRDSTLMCGNGGGMISITDPGQVMAVIS